MTSQSIMLPISSSRMKPRGICKKSGNNAPQNRIWITYTRQQTEWWMRLLLPYALCAQACAVRPTPGCFGPPRNHLLNGSQPHASQCWTPALAPSVGVPTLPQWLPREIRWTVPLTWGPQPLPGPQTTRPRLSTRTYRALHRLASDLGTPF